MTKECVLSSFFSNNMNQEDDISDKFLHLADELNIRLEKFKVPSKVHCVYNPTIYARYTYEMYVRRYCNTKKKIMYFGMNPGPWGMSQTGVREYLVQNLLFIQQIKSEFLLIPLRRFSCIKLLRHKLYINTRIKLYIYIHFFLIKNK